MIKSAFIRRGQVREWLSAEGISGWKIEQLFTSRVIIPCYLPGKKTRALYSRAQVERDVVAPLRSAAAV